MGAGTARACARAGARLVGVSTVEGLLADSAGLDVEELLALRERYGDRFVDHGPRPPRPREELFELDCDVLVPGARPDSITVAVAERLSCAVVVPERLVAYVTPPRITSTAISAYVTREFMTLPLLRYLTPGPSP